MQITKKDVVAYVAANNNLSKVAAEKIVTDVFAKIADEVDDANEVSINGFGKFSQKVNAARTGRNPSTGAPLEIAESIGMKFSASKTLKDLLNS